MIDLSGVTPNWDKNLPAAQRFARLPGFNNDAVRDNETGLVWEKSPQTTATWVGARSVCLDKIVGGRRGWRLPSIPELASLVDPAVAPPDPTLSPGHPFLNVQSATYWSASSDADRPSGAWVVNFGNGVVGGGDKAGIGLHVWCVRGGMHADAY